MKFLIRQRIEMNGQNAPLVLTQPFEYGDKAAHRWEVEIVRGGVPENLQGVGCTGYIHRHGDNATLNISGAVSGNVAAIDFPAEAYATEGALTAILRVETSSEITCMAILRGVVMRNTSDTIVDTGHVIPDISALLEQISIMEAATSEAERIVRESGQVITDVIAATSAANTAADAANSAAEYARSSGNEARNQAQGYANSAAESAAAAQTATQHAPMIGNNNHWYVWDAETGIYRDTNVSATGPKGDQGPAGLVDNATITSIAGLEEKIGELEAADDALGVRIDSMDVGVSSVNGKSGAVVLTAEDVGAMTSAVEERTVSVPTTGWVTAVVGSNGTKNMTGVDLPTGWRTVLCDVDISGVKLDVKKARLSAWAGIYSVDVSGSTVSLEADPVPTVDLPIRMLFMR